MRAAPFPSPCSLFVAWRFNSLTERLSCLTVHRGHLDTPTLIRRWFSLNVKDGIMKYKMTDDCADFSELQRHVFMCFFYPSSSPKLGHNHTVTFTPMGSSEWPINLTADARLWTAGGGPRDPLGENSAQQGPGLEVNPGRLHANRHRRGLTSGAIKRRSCKTTRCLCIPAQPCLIFLYSTTNTPESSKEALTTNPSVFTPSQCSVSSETAMHFDYFRVCLAYLTDTWGIWEPHSRTEKPQIHELAAAGSLLFCTLLLSLLIELFWTRFRGGDTGRFVSGTVQWMQLWRNMNKLVQNSTWQSTIIYTKSLNACVVCTGICLINSRFNLELRPWISLKNELPVISSQRHISL